MAVFHFTFCVSLKVRGRFLASEIPWPVGPRNWGQFSSPWEREWQAIVTTMRVEKIRCIFVSPKRIAPGGSAHARIPSRWMFVSLYHGVGEIFAAALVQHIIAKFEVGSGCNGYRDSIADELDKSCPLPKMRGRSRWSEN